MTTLETPQSAVLLNQQIGAINEIVPNLSANVKQQLAEALVAAVKVASFPCFVERVEKVRDLSMSMLIPRAHLGVMNNSGIALNLRSVLRADCFVQVLGEIGITVGRELSDAIHDKMCGDEPSRMAGIDARIQYVDGEAYVSFGTV